MSHGLGKSWCIHLGIAMVSRVITNMVLMDWMKRSVSTGTRGSKQPSLDSNSTEEIPGEDKGKERYD